MTDGLIEVSSEEDVPEGATDAWFWAAYLEDEEPTTSVFDLSEGYKMKSPRRKPGSKSGDGWAAKQQKDIDALAILWEDKFADIATECFENELRELLAVLSEAKKKSLQEKATVNWKWIGTAWKKVLKKATDLWVKLFASSARDVFVSQGMRWSTVLEEEFNREDLPSGEWFEEYALKFAQPINDTTTKTITKMLEQAVEEKWSVPKMEGNLKKMFKQWMTGELSADDFAWYKDRLPPHRIATIVRTETMRAANAGTLELFRVWGVKLKEWQGTDDDKIRDTHKMAWMSYSEGGKPGPIPLDEMFKVGDSEMMFPLDPRGSLKETINCLIPSTEVEGIFQAGLKAGYSGPVWKIQTARGYRLTVTPNHPILTEQGWLAAYQLREGMNLFSYAQDVRASMQGDIDDQNRPPTIKDVFEALGANGRFSPAMATALDLHGDARWADGKIDVVGVNRVLQVNGQVVSNLQDASNRDFVMALEVGGPESSQRPPLFSFQGIGLPASSFPRSRHLTLESGGVLLDGLPFNALGFGSPTNWDPVLKQESADGRAAASSFVGQLLLASSGQIAVDHIVGVREYDFTGHVYDLQSPLGWIVAQNIIISNCRCVLLPGLGINYKEPMRE